MQPILLTWVFLFHFAFHSENVIYHSCVSDFKKRSLQNVQKNKIFAYLCFCSLSCNIFLFSASLMHPQILFQSLHLFSVSDFEEVRFVFQSCSKISLDAVSECDWGLMNSLLPHSHLSHFYIVLLGKKLLFKPKCAVYLSFFSKT